MRPCEKTIIKVTSFTPKLVYTKTRFLGNQFLQLITGAFVLEIGNGKIRSSPPNLELDGLYINYGAQFWFT